MKKKQASMKRRYIVSAELPEELPSPSHDGEIWGYLGIRASEEGARSRRDLTG